MTPDPPDTLVGRRLATLAWGMYRAAGAPSIEPDAWFEQDWVGLGDGLEAVHAARYLRRHVRPERVAFRVNTVLALADAVEAGLGIGPLPCYVADARPGLVRLAPPDPDLAASLWLLTHEDLRRTPRVRALMDALADGIAAERGRLAGEL